MFERYTVPARRVIFFASYEARNYGSSCIEAEHLLLGVLRRDKALARMFLGQGNVEAEIRAEIERHITRREPIPTSVEVPLTEECKKILNLAGEESERLGYRHIGTEHLLLGILGVQGSLAAHLLQTKGLKAGAVREQLAKTSGSENGVTMKGRRDEKAKLRLDSFLAGLKWHSSEELIEFFAKNAQFIDVFGKSWNREEILKKL